MFKLHFFQGIKCINSYNWFQKFAQQKHAPFYESECSLEKLDEKPIHTKISKFWNFERKGYNVED
jgi:hypothetical protein